jgi:hypothetical protein
VTSNEDILNKLLESEAGSISSFREQYPEFWNALGSAIDTTGAILPKVYACVDRTEMELFGSACGAQLGSTKSNLFF